MFFTLARSINSGAMTNLAKLPLVDIDAQGTFKYILIKATEGDATKLTVRGYKRCKFHANILAEVEAKESAGGQIQFECPGGGRIRHEQEKNALFVYGYSQGFGRADHTLAVKLLQGQYPDYKIDWSNDGY